MNAESFAILGLMLTVVAALMGALPALMRPTVPLGVSVPASRLGEAVIRRAIRRFRAMVAIAWLVCVVLLAVLAATAPAATQLLVVFLFVIAQLVAYVFARRMIVTAKRDGGWYEGVPVRMTGTVSAPSASAPVPIGWFTAAVVLLVCAYAVGIVLYPSFPLSLPTHWGLDGHANASADKNVWTVFGPLLVGTVVIVGLFALSFLGRSVPIRALPGADAEANARREHEMRAAMATLIGRLILLLAIEFSWTTLAPRLLPGVAAVAAIGPIVVVALIVVIVIMFIVRWRHLMQGDARIVAAERVARDSVDAPDDDRFWKAGILYLNRDDPALFVQRRFGVGWTPNLGRPAGMIITIVVAVLIVGLIAFAITQAAMNG